MALVDAAGEPVSAVDDYFNSLLRSGASPGSVRSYALALAPPQPPAQIAANRTYLRGATNRATRTLRVSNARA